MIRKLKKKFVLINMSLVTIVLFIVFSAILFTNWQREQNMLKDSLHHALERSESLSDAKPFEIGRDHKTNPSAMATAIPQTAIFTVVLTPDGNSISHIYANRNTTVSDTVAQQAVNAVLSSSKNAGYISSYSLQYLCQTDSDGILKIAFADLTTQKSNMASLCLSSACIGIGGFLAFLCISIFLSDWALRPVSQAWIQQRQFIADASHELKTPLTVILANTDILLAHPTDTIHEQSKWIEHTQHEAQRMKNMVEDLLFLARSDASPVPHLHTEFDLSDTAWACLLPFEPVAFEKGVFLTSEVTPHIILTGDSAKMKQLLLILLDNACKYAGNPGTITFTLTRTTDKAYLRINNTGDPIAPEHLPHLFERFYRTDKARTRAEGGYGLGLSIAERIVTEHHGLITVQSNSMDGTTFTVMLPLK